MIKIEEKKGEKRAEYLVRLAIEFIKTHSGFYGVDDRLFYDDAECDGYCLADDLMIEFDINDY